MILVEKLTDDFDSIDIVEKLIEKVEYSLGEENSCCGLSLTGDEVLFISDDGSGKIIAFDQGDTATVLDTQVDLYDFIVDRNIAEIVFAKNVKISYEQTKNYAK